MKPFLEKLGLGLFLKSTPMPTLDLSALDIALKDVLGEAPRLISASAPTVILVSDVQVGDSVNLLAKRSSQRYGASDDYRILLKLEKLGFSTVALEGWAGSLADKKRGFMLLNGEEQLIPHLLSEKAFNVIPLEDAREQEVMHVCRAIWNYARIKYPGKTSSDFEKAIAKLHLNREQFVQKMHMCQHLFSVNLQHLFGVSTRDQWNEMTKNLAIDFRRVMPHISAVRSQHAISKIKELLKTENRLVVFFNGHELNEIHEHLQKHDVNIFRISYAMPTN